MSDFAATLAAFKDTSIPVILVIGGFIFMFIAVIGGLTGSINIVVTRGRQLLAGLVGLVSFLIGLQMSGVPVTLAGSSTPTPTPMPVVALKATSVATPVAGNLIANAGFETLTSGWADHWVNKNKIKAVTIDTQVQGYEGSNSLHFAPTSKVDTLVLGENIAVTPDASYTWEQYVVVVGMTEASTGEFGFYIDEYDAQNDWISGQWEASVEWNTNGWVSFPYQPTDSNVAFISVQYYMKAGTPFDVFVDAVSFTQD